MVIRGVVVGQSNHTADGVERVELYVYRDFDQFIEKPKPHRREPITLITPTGTYLAGLRTLQQNQEVYICPDLYLNGSRLSLARVLADLKIGPHDEVNIEVKNRNWKILQKATTSASSSSTRGDNHGADEPAASASSKPLSRLPSISTEGRTNIVIDDAFIREWDSRYDDIATDEPEYWRLVKMVSDDIAATGTLSMPTFLAIWKWKGAMRVIRFVRLEAYKQLYAEAFRQAIAEPPQQRMYVLIGPGSKLPGVGAATASTLLHFMKPAEMPIIDVRTVSVLFAAGLVSSRHKDLEHYDEFRQAILRIARSCPGRTLREIDRALFAYDTTVLDNANQVR